MVKGVSEAKIKEMLKPDFGVDKLWEELDKLTEVVKKMSTAFLRLEKGYHKDMSVISERTAIDNQNIAILDEKVKQMSDTVIKMSHDIGEYDKRIDYVELNDRKIMHGLHLRIEKMERQLSYLPGGNVIMPDQRGMDKVGKK